MKTKRKEIYVYAHWKGMKEPTHIGVLIAQYAKGRKFFSFEYDKTWVKTKAHFMLDPDISWFSGPQYPVNKGNFGIFMDSMPDTWGKTLMKRREIQLAKEENRPVNNLYDIDFLLGVFDESRMGALRFKTNPNGAFLDHDERFPTPNWSSLTRKIHRK